MKLKYAMYAIFSRKNEDKIERYPIIMKNPPYINHPDVLIFIGKEAYEWHLQNPKSSGGITFDQKRVG